jgi:hypothetical protein
MLTVAAVIGREFRLPVLEAVANQGERRLAFSAPFVGEGQGKEGASNLSILERLDEALAARLIVPVPQNVGRYSFTHTLIQETLYEGIATIERLRRHRRIGDALEAMAGDHIVPFLPELAHHFFQAAQSGDVIDKAISYAISAAEGAQPFWLPGLACRSRRDACAPEKGRMQVKTAISATAMISAMLRQSASFWMRLSRSSRTL